MTLPPAPAIGQLVLAQRVHDSGGRDGTAQAAGSRMRGGQHREVRYLAGPVAVPGGGDDPVFFVDHERRGTDLGDPALGEITSVRFGQEPPECEARDIKACTGGLARCRAEIGGIKVGQEQGRECRR